MHIALFAAALSFAVVGASLRAEEVWELRATLSPAPTVMHAAAQHGRSVAVDGDTAVVGTPNAHFATGFGMGAATVYRVATGALLASLPDPHPGTGHSFGVSVAVSGNRVVVGAARHAFVYDLSGASPAVPVFVLESPLPGYADSFGMAVAISGSRVVVGATPYYVGAGHGGRAYVYDVASGTPALPIAILENPTAQEYARFGTAVAISGDRVIAGAPLEGNGGAAYAFDLGSATPAVPVAVLENPNPAFEDYFGESVAVSGARAVVGAPGKIHAGGEADAGAVCVYELGGATPSQPALILRSPAPAAQNRFGISVAIFEDRVAAGEYGASAGVRGAGVVHLFDLGGATATIPVETIQHPQPDPYDYFGRAVAISGNALAVGQVSPFSYYDGPTDAGTAYLFAPPALTATTHAPVSALVNPTPFIDDEFGYTVAASGNLIVVGAPADKTGAANAGAAYVFDQTSQTPAAPVAVLRSPAPTESGYFGASVAVSGSRVIVGEIGCDHGAMDAGAAYVFDLTSATPGTPVATLHNPSPAASEYFGRSVAISGRRAVVGAMYADSGGAAYAYDLAGVAPAVPVATLRKPDAAFDDLFGYSVAISGTRIVAGAMNDDSAESNAGAAFVFDLASVKPAVPVAILRHPSPAGGNQFGISVAISAHRVAIGARDDRAGAPGIGSAFVFDLESATPTVPATVLHFPKPLGFDTFGASVAIADSRVVVGVSADDSAAENPGVAYGYDIGSATAASPVAILRNPGPGFGYFGSAVAIAGTRTVVSSHLDDMLNLNGGAAYIFSEATQLERWRFTHFGSIADSGPGADANDFDGDGLANLLEFATLRDPARPGGAIGALSKNGGALKFTFSRATAAAIQGVRTIVEWSDSLAAGTWSIAGVAETILSDDGVRQEVAASVPAGSTGRRFVRLRAALP